MKQHLNDAQMQAILHQKGPMLVLAGPGSGKTLVITKRIERLITYGKVDPSNILVITFTRAAAKEMKERFCSVMPAEGQRVTFGTFHAVFFMILKYAYRMEASNIIREEERMQLIRDMICSMRLDYEDETELIQNLLSEISFIKNGRIDLKHYYPICCSQDIFVHVFREYESVLRRSRKIDFDDMLVYTYELFSARSDILSAWQKKFRYLLVDEFQDVNQIQYDIVRMLCGKEQNLFAVGDDDQSIYRFRGAKPEIMLHMPKDFSDAQVVNLSYNYRCPVDVTRLSSHIISYNKERFPKQMQAVSRISSSITAELFETQGKEYEAVIDRIRERGSPYKQTAVLFRTNTQAGALMEQLMAYDIPFTAKDNIPNLYEHWIAKDFFAYIRIAEGSRKRRDFLMIMNRPKRYLSRERLEGEDISFTAWQAFYAEQPWIEARIEKLAEDLLAIRRMRPFAAINYIRRGVGYDDFLKEYAGYKKIEPDGLLEKADALQESSREFASFAEWSAHIKRYQKELEEVYKREGNREDAVTLATFHSAKGLEFDTVHIIDANEGITPYKKAVLPADMEEERRMFYVALTRAKQELHLYASKKIHNHEAEVSRFLIEGREYLPGMDVCC